MLRRGLDMRIRATSLDEEKSVGIDVDSNEGGAFRMIDVCALTGPGQPDFFIQLEIFLGTTRLL